MLSGYDFVYFAPEEWDSLWRNRQQLMSRFAAQNRVLFVERRLYLRPTLASFRRNELKGSDLRHPLVRRVADNLFVFRYPLWAPISGQWGLAHITAMIRRLAIRAALRKLRMSRPIVWLSRPGMADLINEIPGARLLIYHVVDEYTAYSGTASAKRRRMQERENRILACADMVIVVSQNLYKAKWSHNAHTYIVPNGVDYQGYSAALADPELPDDLGVIPHPRLGYVGLVGDKLNLDMLRELAQHNPDWSLIFLGEVRLTQQADVWQALKRMPNVYHLEPVSVQQVPHYVKGFDVGLMPYLQNRHAAHINPLKLYDYLAAGIPVASMDIPASSAFGQYIHLSDSPSGFGRAVRAALDDTTPLRHQSRRNVASQHTWEARVEQLSSLIEMQLAARPEERHKLRDRFEEVTLE